MLQHHCDGVSIARGTETIASIHGEDPRDRTASLPLLSGNKWFRQHSQEHSIEPGLSRDVLGTVDYNLLQIGSIDCITDKEHSQLEKTNDYFECPIGCR